MTAVLHDLESSVLETRVRAALGAVVDPELDEPITDLGFVRSVSVHGTTVEVHLRLPTSFCAPNFAYLMAADAQHAVAAVPGVERVVVELDDHHDSDLINRGLATAAGYRGTFGHEAEESLDELRATFHRKAHTAAMERAVTACSGPTGRSARRPCTTSPSATCPPATPARRRSCAGGPRWACRSTPPLRCWCTTTAGVRPGRTPRLRLRRARSVRISVDGNAHFCRGLLRTRYPGSASDQAPRADDDGAQRPLLPLLIDPKGT